MIKTEAVYSDQYTGSDKLKAKNRYIQRVPYYTLVKRIFGERDDNNVQLSEQLDVVKKRCASILNSVTAKQNSFCFDTGGTIK